ncbi:MAG: ComF family protein [Muribaculaceae bacterium]|nr:ComF family protein [Muribaculaceae bacterium]
MNKWLHALADVLMPRTCAVCGQALGLDEPYLCPACELALPRTHYENESFNAMEQLAAGRTPIERAAGYFFYEKASPYAAILHDIKYRNMPLMGQWLCRQAARHMQQSNFFEGIDAIAPVPLHRSKLADRGYNQSQYLAQGLADVTGIQLVQALTATRPHATQTRKSAQERWENIQDMYAPRSSAARQLAGKHILIVDDVITTGATLIACSQALHQLPGVRISWFTLAVARLD